jgi:hypothetical protein
VWVSIGDVTGWTDAGHCGSGVRGKRVTERLIGQMPAKRRSWRLTVTPEGQTVILAAGALDLSIGDFHD